MATARGRGYRTARSQLLADATVCWWCKRWISNALPIGHPHKATADHLIPIAEGGPDTIENLVPACWECNCKRGKKGTNWRPSPDVPGAEDW